MEKLQNQYGVALDGCMDEPVWDTVVQQTGFRIIKSRGGEVQKEKTFFKILPCRDRIYGGALRN